MRIGFLSPLALALLASLSQPVQASSDDSCYPDWRVSRDSLDTCNNLPFLSPGNDSRTNLRLLLADKSRAPGPERLGRGRPVPRVRPVPFPVYRLVPITAAPAERITRRTPHPAPNSTPCSSHWASSATNTKQRGLTS
jgi:hypothetical protein